MKTKNTVLLQVRQVARDFGRNKIVRFILLPLWIPFRWYINKKASSKDSEKNNNFHKNGLSVLKDFTDALDNNDIYYTLAFGTMLGAIREHGFIKHDLDIDIMMWISDYSEKIHSCLNDYGFKLKKRYSVDDRQTGYEETYEKNGIGIDIFFLYQQDGGFPYCCDFMTFTDCVSIDYSIKRHGGLMPRKIELPYTRERMKVEFEGLKLYVPRNAHEILKFRYGEDYMIPNKKWSIQSYDNHISILKGKVAKYEDFHN